MIFLLIIVVNIAVMAFVSFKIKKEKAYNKVKEEIINERVTNSILSSKTKNLRSNLNGKSTTRSRRIQNFVKQPLNKTNNFLIK